MILARSGKRLSTIIIRMIENTYYEGYLRTEYPVKKGVNIICGIKKAKFSPGK